MVKTQLVILVVFVAAVLVLSNPWQKTLNPNAQEILDQYLETLPDSKELVLFAHKNIEQVVIREPDDCANNDRSCINRSITLTFQQGKRGFICDYTVIIYTLTLDERNMITSVTKQESQTCL